jgi:phosphoribosylaminoimidazolecarboxamide formyltransferase / IMP cyclohydrolase
LYDDCIKNIDIGGPSMIRSTMKNHISMTIVTSVAQHENVKQYLLENNGATTYALRQSFAYAAFTVTAQYHCCIAQYLQSHTTSSSTALTPTTTTTPTDVLSVPVIIMYEPKLVLKYGCNPHQAPAMIYQRMHHTLPFMVLNGTPGYINLVDAWNAYELMMAFSNATGGLPAVTSFKHVSPAGVAVYVPLTELKYQMYDISDK